MSQVNIEEKEKNVIKLSFTVTTEEAKPYLDEAAKRISNQKQIPGFRPGKAGYDVVKNSVGEMKIYEEALETIVRKSFLEAVLANDIETVGSPKIDVEKLVPGNDIVFTAEVTRMPSVSSLVDYTKLSIKAKEPKVEDHDIDIALKDIQRMQTKEVRAEAGSSAKENDKLVVSMNMKKNGVPIDGGQSPNHIIFMTEDYYIPGLKDEVVGMKEGDEKTFTLKFPEEHVQKLLAGHDVEFEVKLKELFHLQPPELNDEFATRLGVADMKTLKEIISTNILDEKKQEESFRQEKELLELVAEKSKFDDIPDLLLNEEINKMISELKQGVEQQGADFETYLHNLKKTLAQIKLDFSPQALTRIKVALIMRTIAKNETIEVKEDEVNEELDKLAERYEDPEAKKQIFSPQYRDYVEQMMKNRKVIEKLKKAMIK